MAENSIFSSQPFEIRKLIGEHVAYYPISKTSHQYIFFSKERLYLMYHLLRFGYFDRMIIENVYYTLSLKTSLTKQWLQSLIGGKSYPISEFTEFKDGKKKIYYINKVFADWLLEEIQKHEDIIQDVLVTEYSESMHSISTNNITGGKPRSVNHHDLMIRRIASDCSRAVVQATTLEIQKPSEKMLNIQYSFPTNRVITNILPDATIFINGVPFYIEYDAGTEKQWKLHSKILRYTSNPEFKNATIYFVFKVSTKRELSKRISNFLMNIENKGLENEAILSTLNRAGVVIYGYPVVNAIEQMSTTICQSLNLLQPFVLTPEILNRDSSFPYEVESISLPHIEEDFVYFLDITNEYYETESVPVLIIDYGKAGNNQYLRNVYNCFHGTYDRVALMYSCSMSEQYQQFDFDGYFIPIYFESGRESEELF